MEPSETIVQCRRRVAWSATGPCPCSHVEGKGGLETGLVRAVYVLTEAKDWQGAAERRGGAGRSLGAMW